MVINPKHIPLEDDLAILGKFVLQYRSVPDQKNLQLVVLAQRTVIERSRGIRYRRGRMSEVYALVDSIIQNDNIAAGYAARIHRNMPLAKKWKSYVQAGIIE